MITDELSMEVGRAAGSIDYRYKRTMHAYGSASDARAMLTTCLEFYNSRRPHSRIDRRTLDDVYFDLPSLKAAT